MGNFMDLNLNEMQKQAVISDSKYILVTAGAGSGKTRVLTERIMNLINCRYFSPQNILAITFTNKASAVMKERLAQKGLNITGLWISTFHSTCVRILRENANKIQGYTQNFTIYDEGDKSKVIADILKEENNFNDAMKKKLSYHISNFKNKIQTLEEYKNDNFYESEIEDICRYIKIYEKKLKSNNAFDFDDLLQKTYILLKNNEDVLSYYQRKFKNILIDEFQDTNEIQYDFVKILAGKDNSVFVVGDEDQCIYSWRGANYKNISNFCKDFENVEIIKLEQNYRSSKKIIDVANKIISKNVERIDKRLWTDNSEGVKIEFKKSQSEKEEADYVATTIYQLNRLAGYKLSDIAVLVRLNSLTRNIEEKLLNNGINYRVYGGMKFYDRLEIKNFLAYLKVLCNDKDDLSFSKIANWPKRGIGEVSLQNLKNSNPNLSMFENLMSLDTNTQIKGTAFNKLYSLKNILEDFLKQKESLNLVDFVHYIVDKLNLKQILNIEEEDKNRMLNIEQLVLSIEEFAKNNEDCSLNDYLQSVTLVSDIDSYNEDDDCVTIATVHASKGLEFKCVFVVALEDGIFPLKRQYEECDEEEERRLMYVAVTRAMERLYLTCAKSRFLYGYTHYEIVSQYIKDLGFDKEQERYNDYFKERNYYSYDNQANDGYTFDYNQPKSTIACASQIEVKSVNDKEFNVGDKVNHKKFGDGIIISINGDICKISFAGIGIKELMLSFAPLTKI
ncbi:MAG: ATP-dependent helicase [Christensenellales bacterium]